MRIGAIFPQTEFGTDPAALRDYAQAVAGMGYTHILAYDHVLGASTASRPDWQGPYTSETSFHEPFVLFGFFAAVAPALELVTGIIILPQRQTALVAKQAAEVDILTGGKFRLGIGVGWNPVEYQALNEDFTNRGARSAEQIRVLRALWSAHAITFQGKWHHIEDAGINPLPMRRSIPIWIGGASAATLKRIASLGDGWFPQMPPDDRAKRLLDQLRAAIREAGRDPASVGIEARLTLSQTPEPTRAGYVSAWRDLGATHLGINTMGLGLAKPQAHIDMLGRVKQALGI